MRANYRVEFASGVFLLLGIAALVWLAMRATDYGQDIGKVRLASLRALFAQPKNAANPKFLRMIRDVLNFNKNGLRLSEEEGLTVGGLIEKLGAGSYFRDYYLLPLSGAIWSTGSRSTRASTEKKSPMSLSSRW